jgi:hypothetical protein
LGSHFHSIPTAQSQQVHPSGWFPWGKPSSICLDQGRAATTTKHECATCQRSPCDKANKVFSLGSLIYGAERWKAQAPPELLQFEELQGIDPLTSSFDKAFRDGMHPRRLVSLLFVPPLTDKNFFEGKITFRELTIAYLPEFEPQSILAADFKAKKCPKRPTYHNRISEKLNVYSVIPNYHPNSYPDMKQ